MLGELTEERISELEAWLMGLTGEPPRGVSGDRRTVARLLCPTRSGSSCAIWPRGFLLHGSRKALDVIQPYAQTDWSGRTVRAAFATTDPILAIFFAVIRREAVRSIRNGGFLIEPSPGAISPGAVKSEIVIERFYFFTVEEADSSGRSDLLADGFVHVVDRDGFATSDAPIRFDEWRSPSVGPVVMRLPVSPEDFPFRGSIVRHGDESVVHSWLRYKERLARQAG